MKQKVMAVIYRHWQTQARHLMARLQSGIDLAQGFLESKGPETLSRIELPPNELAEPIAARIRNRDKPTEFEAKRVEKALKNLLRLREKWMSDIPTPLLVELDSNSGALVKKYNGFIAPVVEALSRVRLIERVVAGAFEPKRHEPFYSDFGWKHLTDREMALCPPFVVYTDFNEDWSGRAGDLYSLLAKGVPFKVAVFQDHINFHQFEEGRAIHLMAHPDLGFMGLGLRNTYVVQIAGGMGQPCEQEMLRALQSNRPVLLSVYQGPSRDAEELALASRAFPCMRFDPDQGFDWSACLDLSANPAVNQDWVVRQVPHPEDPEKTLDLPLTFAHFAFGVEQLRSEFVKITDPDDTCVTLVEYFKLSPNDRARMRPFIWAGEPLERWAPSENLISQTRDKAKLWYSLQTLVGIHNPHAERAVAQGSVALENQRAWDTAVLEAERAELNQQYEEQMEQVRKEAVQEAVDLMTERLKRLDQKDLRAQLRALPELEIFLIGSSRK